jgi:protein O-GlcNAc transferase
VTTNCVFCYDCKKFNNGKHFRPGIRRNSAMLWDNSRYLWNKKKSVYKKCKMTIVVSSKWLADIVRRSILIGKKIRIINNGVDTKIFKPVENKDVVRKVLRIPFHKKVILFSAQGGISDPRKGGYYFREVAKNLLTKENIFFICVGGGKRRVREGNVLYIPFINNRQRMAKFYQSADAFLFLSRADTNPLSVLEAMACGLPVISFAIGGVKEQLEHKKNGYLIKEHSPAAIIEGITWVFGSGNAKSIVKSNIRKIAKRFGFERVVNEYVKLYESL